MRHTLPVLCGALLLAALSGLVNPAAGQGGLSGAVQGFTSAWSQANVEALSLTFAPRLRLHLPERQFNVLSRKQAVAAIESFLNGRVTSQAQVLRQSDTGEDPQSGFAEIRWSSSADGTANETTYIIFVAIVEADGAWQIEEIRVLR